VEENIQDTGTKKTKEPFIPWEGKERARPDWFLIKHGETVAPQKDQASNNNLANNLVLQSRDEKVSESSQATPITGRDGTSSDVSDHDSGSKKTYPTSGGIAL